MSEYELKVHLDATLLNLQKLKADFPSRDENGPTKHQFFGAHLAVAIVGVERALRELIALYPELDT